MTYQSTLPFVLTFFVLGLVVWVVSALRSDLRMLRGALLRVAARKAAGPDHAASEPPPVAPSLRAIPPPTGGHAIAEAFELESLARLMLAQHWARASISYPPGDPSKPLVMGLAIAALLCRSTDELSSLLHHQGVSRGALEPLQAHNGEAWETFAPSTATLRAALMELAQARQGQGLVFDDADGWDWARLLARAEDMLVDALAQTDREAEQAPRASSAPANDFC